MTHAEPPGSTADPASDDEPFKDRIWRAVVFDGEPDFAFAGNTRRTSQWKGFLLAATTLIAAAEIGAAGRAVAIYDKPEATSEADGLSGREPSLEPTANGEPVPLAIPISPILAVRAALASHYSVGPGETSMANEWAPSSPGLVDNESPPIQDLPLVPQIELPVITLADTPPPDLVAGSESIAAIEARAIHTVSVPELETIPLSLPEGPPVVPLPGTAGLETSAMPLNSAPEAAARSETTHPTTPAQAAADDDEVAKPRRRNGRSSQSAGARNQPTARPAKPDGANTSDSVRTFFFQHGG